MLTAYFDDSGKLSSPEHDFFVMGGVASTIKGWRGFDMAWNACLHNEAPRMKLLKTADFFALKGEYDPKTSRWTAQKRDRKICRLSEIAARHTLLGIALAIDLRMLRRMDLSSRLGKDCDPFLFCYPVLLSGMQNLIDHLGKRGIRLDMIYDEERNGNANERARQLFAEELREANGLWLNRVIPSTDEKDVELQAADMYAWQQRRRVSGLSGKEWAFHPTHGKKTVMHAIVPEEKLRLIADVIAKRRERRHWAQ